MNIAVTLALKGDLDIDRLQRTLGELSSRHEALSATLTGVDTSPNQYINAPIDPIFSHVDLGAMEFSSRPRAVTGLLAAESDRSFDLCAGPAWAVLLIGLRHDRHILHIVGSHLMMDGWSLRVIVEELCEIYAGRLLPALDRNYGDYVLEARNRADDIDRRTSYWRQELGVERTSSPRTDYPTHPLPLYFRASESFDVDLDPLLLNDFCRDHRITPYMLHVAAYSVLLSRIAGTDRVVIGTSMARRDLHWTENLVGYLVDAIFLPVNTSPDSSGRSLVEGVRSAALNAFENVTSYWPIAKAVNPAFEVQRPWPGINLYDAWVSSPPIGRLRPQYRMNGIEARPLAFDPPGGIVDIDIANQSQLAGYGRQVLPSLFLNGSAGSIDLGFNRVVYAPRTIRALGRQHCTILRELVGDPFRRVCELSNSRRLAPSGRRRSHGEH